MEKLSLHPFFGLFKRPAFYRRPIYAAIEKPDAHFFAYDEQGMYYRVHIETGETAVQIGTHWLPIAGCPFPERLVYSRTMATLARNTRQLANMLMLVLCLWALQTLILATPGNLLGSDFAENIIQIICTWMNAGLFTITMLAFIAIALRSFKGGLTITLPSHNSDEPLALGAGSFDVAPDVIVTSVSADEKPGEYTRRLRDATENSIQGQYVIMAPFRSHIFVVIDGAQEIKFTRNKPPFDLPEFSGVSDAEFCGENFGQYSHYIAEFCKAFKVWSIAEKMDRSGSPSLTYIRNSMMPILFFLIPFFGFSQSVSKQVSDYLGAARYTTEAPNEQVLYKFEKKPIYRNGDGVKSFEQLLIDVPGATFNDRADLGKLSFVKVGAEMIEPVKRASGTAQMSAGATLTRIESNGEMSGLQKMATGSMVVDSSTFATGMHHGFTMAAFYKSYFWRNYGKTFFGYSLLAFWACFVLIASPLVFFIVVGKTAKENGHLGERGLKIQRWASNNAYTINVSLFLFAMAIVTSHVFFNEWSLPAALFAIVLTGFVGYNWINTLTPDSLSWRKAEPTGRNGYNGPGLNSGR